MFPYLVIYITYDTLVSFTTLPLVDRMVVRDDGIEVVWEEDDYNLSNLMIDYYSNFVKSSNPNFEGHNIWLKQTKDMSKVMVFNKNPYFGKINKCKLYLSLFGLHGKGEN